MNKKYNTKYLYICLFVGLLLGITISFGVKDIFKMGDEKTKNDYYILKNQISKMNKMVVLEQDYSSLHKTNVQYEFLGKKISENEIIAFTKTNAQVSFDLNKMELVVDSVKKKLIINSLPKPDIRITPVVEIQSIDDSFFNRVDGEQIKKVTETAKKDAISKINQEQLKKEGKMQLLENLNSIFVLAKALNYTIDDQTKSINLSNF